MKGINFSKSSFIDLIVKMFLPILIIVVIVGIVLFIYSKNAEKKGVTDYKNKVNFHSALISIVITLILLAITVCFSVNFINVMRSENLIENNKIVYYTVIGSPLIPFIFLIYLIVRFVKSLSGNNYNNKIEEKENELTSEDSVPNVEIGVVNTSSVEEPLNDDNIPKENQKDDIELL